MLSVPSSISAVDVMVLLEALMTSVKGVDIFALLPSLLVVLPVELLLCLADFGLLLTGYVASYFRGRSLFCVTNTV